MGDPGLLTRLDLFAALSRLTPLEREVVVDRCILGRPHRDIASRLGKNPEAVMDTYSRGLRKLRADLDKAA